MNKLTSVLLVLVVILSSMQSGNCEEEPKKPSKGLAQRYTPDANIEIIKRRLTNVWNLVSRQFSNPNPDTFIGRCIGAAKGLKVAMPLIIFKLGVIVTIVTFLTIFSLKSLGILLTLLFFNITGAFSKFAYLLKSDHTPKHHHTSPPQTVHFHLHNKGEHGGYGVQHHGGEHVEHEHAGGWVEHQTGPDYGSSGWSEKSAGALGQQVVSDFDRVELQNLYKRLGITRASDGRVIPVNYEVHQRRK